MPGGTMTISKKAALSLSVAIAAFGMEAAAQVPPPPTPQAAGQLPPGQLPPGQPPPAPPAFPPNLQAGGLVPPPPSPQTPQMAPQAAPTPTEKLLEDAKKEDSKRGLEWFWINAEGGFSFIDMRAFSSGQTDFTAGFVPAQAIGGSVGGGLGARLLFFTIGGRGRFGFYDPWQMFSAGGEIGFHIPLGRLDPHIELGGGYTALLNVRGQSKAATDAVTVSGGYGRLSGGVDVYVVPRFSVGVTASGDFLALARPGLSAAQIQAIKGDPKTTEIQRAAADGLAAQGQSFGVAVGVTAVLGLHF
jgi:hypothetical protein